MPAMSWCSGTVRSTTRPRGVIARSVADCPVVTGVAKCGRADLRPVQDGEGTLAGLVDEVRARRIERDVDVDSGAAGCRDRVARQWRVGDRVGNDDRTRLLVDHLAEIRRDGHDVARLGFRCGESPAGGSVERRDQPVGGVPDDRGDPPAVGREDHRVEERGEILAELECGSRRRIRRADVRGQPALDPTRRRVDEHQIDGRKVGADDVDSELGTVARERDRVDRARQRDASADPPPRVHVPQVERARLRVRVRRTRRRLETDPIANSPWSLIATFVTPCATGKVDGDECGTCQSPRPIRAQVPDAPARQQQPGVVDRDVRTRSSLRRLVRQQRSCRCVPHPQRRRRPRSTRSSCRPASTSPPPTRPVDLRGSRSAPAAPTRC